MRGDIVELKNDRKSKGHEQKGRRYAVVLQSDFLLTSTMIVAPTTSSERVEPNDHRPRIMIPGAGESTVLVAQIKAVDVERGIGRTVGHVLHKELAEIDEALRLVLGLDEIAEESI